MQAARAPIPTDIRLHRQSRTLELVYAGDARVIFPCEFLRVISPSAEVQGHGEGQAILQTGKRDVNIVALEATGNYALRIVFDDGHDSGIYSWEYLHQLAQEQENIWQDYLTKLTAAGASRDAPIASTSHTPPKKMAYVFDPGKKH